MEFDQTLCACGCGEAISSVRNYDKASHPTKYKNLEHAHRHQAEIRQSRPHRTPSEALRLAHDELLEAGWCQGTLALIDSGSGVTQRPRYCLDAAIMRGAGLRVGATAKMRYQDRAENGKGDSYFMVPLPTRFRGRQSESGLRERIPRRLFLAAADYVRRVVGTDSLDDWNDYPGRDVDEVLDALSRAAELAESEGQ